MSTPTPRTDEEAGSLIDAEEVVPADFARTLERELAAERQKVRAPRISMWTSETETARAALQQAYDELGRNRRWHVSALRLNVIKPALITLGGKV